MAITIVSQPTSNVTLPAYRPIIVSCTSSTTIAVMYCDVYKMDSTGAYQYVRSVAKNTAPYTFDLSRIVQDSIPLITPFFNDSLYHDSSLAIFAIKVRTATLNTSGIITQDDTPPVQGTDTTVPVTGTGQIGNVFSAVSATLKHTDNQDLIQNLVAYQNRAWANGAVPLTHRPKVITLSRTDSEYFPVLNQNNQVMSLTLGYLMGGVDRTATINFATTTVPAIVRIPLGVPNIASLFTNVDFNYVTSYFIKFNDHNGNVIGTTSTVTLANVSDTTVRIYFLNALGEYDSTTFETIKETTQIKSASYIKNLPYNFAKSDTGSLSTNLNALEMFEVRHTSYDPIETEWLKEVMISPKLYVQTKGAQNQPDFLEPIFREDFKFDSYSIAKQYKSEMTFVYRKANDIIVIRN